MNTVKIEKQNTKMVAHRGLSGLERENTCMAFVAAGNRSYWGIETDVHVTADGELIVFHDDTTTRCTTERTDLTIEQTDFATLRELELSEWKGNTPKRILQMPTPEEYVEICKKYEKMCVLELKNPMTREAIEKVIDRIRALDYLDQTVFISFCWENLVTVRELLPEQPVQFLFGSFTEELIRQIIDNRFDVDVYHKSLTKEMVDRLHAAGRTVNVWTVDKPEDAEKYASWGVDYITTNILE